MLYGNYSKSLEKIKLSVLWGICKENYMGGTQYTDKAIHAMTE